MSIFASYRYQMADQKRSICVYYLVVIAVLLFAGLLLALPVGGHGTVMTNGVSSVTAIFLFVVGLCSFKENFGMALQNGVSRRSLFLGRLCTTGTVCALLAAIDEVVTLLLLLPGKLFQVPISSQSLFQTLYGEMLGEMNPVLEILCSLFFSFFVFLAASALGYFITILFYRLNKLGKILVGAGVPVFFMVILPVLKELGERFLGGKPAEAVVRFFSGMVRFLLEQPQNAMLTYFGMFAVFSAFAWLLLRRAVVK